MANKTYPEIRNQYQAIAKTCGYIAERANEIKAFYEQAQPKKIVVIGSGSSFYLSTAVQFTANLLLNVPTVAIPAGDLMLHAKDYLPVVEDSLVIVLSRSGETDEIVNAVDQLEKMRCGAKVFSVLCAEDSRVGKRSDFALEMPWAFDESVCQTRSVSTMYAAAQLVLGLLSGRDEIEKSIQAIAQHGDSYLEAVEPVLAEIAREDWKKVYVLADGEANGVAEEAALAFNEISYIPSVCKHVLDVRHGPIVLVDHETLVLIVLNAEGYGYQKALVEDILKKGAKVILYSDMPLSEEIEGVRAAVSFGKPLVGSAVAIPMLLIAQLLSYYNAMARGINPDQPLGLDAWIAL